MTNKERMMSFLERNGLLDKFDENGHKKRLEGLGDVVEKITKSVGVKPCNSCKKRKEDWNKKFPFKMREGNLKSGLQSLVKELGIKNGVMVEVGSFKGESAIIFANSGKFETIYCVDAWSNEYKVVGRPDMTEVENIFDKETSGFPSIKKVKMTSEEGSKFINFEVDIVYIDACHDYDSVKQDIELWLPKIKQGGYIAGHDYSNEFQGVIKAVDERFKNVKTYEDTSWIVRI